MINRTLKPLAAAVALANAGLITPAQAQTDDAAVPGGRPRAVVSCWKKWS